MMILHSAIDRPAPRSTMRVARSGALGPRALLILENYVVGEMREVSRAMSHVFAMPDGDAVYEEIVGLNRAQGYVDVLGELESRLILLGLRTGSLSGAPRCGASRLLASHSIVLRRHDGFASGHCGNMLHFWMSTTH